MHRQSYTHHLPYRYLSLGRILEASRIFLEERWLKAFELWAIESISLLADVLVQKRIDLFERYQKWCRKVQDRLLGSLEEEAGQIVAFEQVLAVVNAYVSGEISSGIL